MLSEEKRNEFYHALVNQIAQYEGVFYVGVKSTGVFCRPTCGGRKPKLENCEFFLTTQDALLASFRPCLRCKPLSHPNHVSDLVRTLVNAVEANPEKRWKDRDFAALSIDASTVRRQFKKRFGMTFVAYARARRMGFAMKQIREGESVIDTQLNTGYESSSGFRDAFSKIMGAAPTHFNRHYTVLKISWLDTALGTMVAIADDTGLYLLEFVDRRGLDREIERLRIRMKSAVIPGDSEIIDNVKSELKLYFDGKLKTFKTPLLLLGTPFQKKVWNELMHIPYGETRSYEEQARTIDSSATRAVGTANAANQLAIVVPCHRVINTDGGLGGYGGGLARKKWLIEHEKKHSS